MASCPVLDAVVLIHQMDCRHHAGRPLRLACQRPRCTAAVVVQPERPSETRAYPAPNTACPVSPVLLELNQYLVPPRNAHGSQRLCSSDGFNGCWGQCVTNTSGKDRTRLRHHRFFGLRFNEYAFTPIDSYSVELIVFKSEESVSLVSLRGVKSEASDERKGPVE